MSYGKQRFSSGQYLLYHQYVKDQEMKVNLLIILDLQVHSFDYLIHIYKFNFHSLDFSYHYIQHNTERYYVLDFYFL